MKSIYLAPTITADAHPQYASMRCPGDPTVSLVVIEWQNDAEQDAWEALPGVTAQYPETFGQPVAPSLVRALRPLGVAPGDTVRQALQKVRASWPVARL